MKNKKFTKSKQLIAIVSIAAALGLPVAAQSRTGGYITSSGKTDSSTSTAAAGGGMSLSGGRSDDGGGVAGSGHITSTDDGSGGTYGSGHFTSDVSSGDPFAALWSWFGGL